jgi:hypothetical protein
VKRTAGAALLALASPAFAADPAPVCDSTEACARIVAEHGMLATIGPMQMQADIKSLIDDNPGLTPEEQEQIRVLGRAKGEALVERAIAAEAGSYAKALSLADLQAMASYVKSDAAAHAREAMPMIMSDVMQQMGKVDFKGEVRAEFCEASGKLCTDD